MQISNQVTQVNHEFEAVQERKITAVASSNQANQLAVSSDQTASAVEEEAYRVTLTPEQEVQKKVIESISNQALAKFYEQQHFARLNFTQDSQSNSAFFELQGHSVTDSRVLSVSEKRYEYEQLDYSTTLQIDHGDDAQTTHSFSLSYARELSIELQLSMTAAEFKDPLVLNIAQKAQLFEQNKQAFDLDGDGQKELIPKLQSGVWYLAHDRNQNGRIDSGLELFGAQTGQGFAELAKFDSNNNALIEADDELFTQLSLWDGKQRLSALADEGVSAISLNAAHTPFTFTDNLGNPIAQIRQTSVFLTDKNTLGAVHQVDIAV